MITRRANLQSRPIPAVSVEYYGKQDPRAHWDTVDRCQPASLLRVGIGSCIGSWIGTATSVSIRWQEAE